MSVLTPKNATYGLQFHKQRRSGKQNQIFGKPAVIVLGLKPCGPCDVLGNFIKTWRPDIPINLFELKAPEFEDMETYREKFDLERFPTVAIVDKDMNVLETKLIPGGNKNIFTDLVMKYKDSFTQ